MKREKKSLEVSHKEEHLRKPKLLGKRLKR